MHQDQDAINLFILFVAVDLMEKSIQNFIGILGRIQVNRIECNEMKCNTHNVPFEPVKLW